MREIKFRAWDTKRNYMCEPASLHNIITGMTGAGQVLGKMPPEVAHGIIYMQYTGLKDKNGVEIYEGDIVKVDCECGYSANMPIEWGFNGYIAKQKYQHNFPSEYLELKYYNRLEVIGNIYENPELLEGR